MRASGDHVGDLRMALDDRRQRLDHGLEALAGRDQAEGREQEAIVGAVVRPERRAVRRRGGCLGAGARREPRRRAVRDDANLLLADRRRSRRAGAAPSPSSRSRARRGRTARSAPRAGAASAARARCAASRRAAGRAPRRTTARTRRRARRRSRTRAAGARRRRRGGRASARRARSRRAPPARWSRAGRAAAGGTARSRPRRCRRASTPATPSSVPRRSAANVPIPHARGGYVETIAVRTAVTSAPRPGARRRRDQLGALRLLEAAADRRPRPELAIGRSAQPFEDSPQALPHDVAPSE